MWSTPATETTPTSGEHGRSLRVCNIVNVISTTFYAFKSNSSVKVVCCDNVELSSSNVDFVNSAYKNLLIGNWSKLSEEVNSRPVYKKGNYFLAVASGSPGLKPNWVATSTPGSQSGFMFEKNFFAPKCPHAVQKWRYFSQNLLQTEDDDSLAVTCGASENKQESNASNHL